MPYGINNFIDVSKRLYAFKGKLGSVERIFITDGEYYFIVSNPQNYFTLNRNIGRGVSPVTLKHLSFESIEI